MEDLAELCFPSRQECGHFLDGPQADIVAPQPVTKGQGLDLRMHY